MNDMSCESLVQALDAAAVQCGHRLLLVIAGERNWGREQAELVYEELALPAALLLADDALASIEPARGLEFLGREFDLLLVDAWAGFDVNTIAAASGALCGGGLMVLLTPPLDTWPESSAGAGAYFADYPDDDIYSFFLQRLVTILEDDPAVTILTPAGVNSPPEVEAGESRTVQAPELPTADQCRAIDAVIRVARGHRRRPLVLRADRGRGKSAALGLAAAELLREEGEQLIVVGPRKEAVETVFFHALTELPGAVRRGSVLHYENGSLRYLPPDVLLRESPAARLVMVDEAAAIPAALLEAILRRYPRVVFATTVHGYEGSGRGFDVRFRQTLDRETPQWTQLALTTPIRWAADDPLERFLARALLLDAEPLADDAAAELEEVEPVCERLYAEDLVENDIDLGQLFGLLVTAHYQTTPEDLRLLLDSPSVSVYVVRVDEEIIASAVVLEEGEIGAGTAEAVASGERRLRGHLVPQSLAFHCGAEEALALRAARITRIAVHPVFRRRGIGSALLRYIERSCSDEGMDYLASSFAADESVVPFWTGQEYLPMRLGSRRDTSSGAHALIVMKALSEAAVELADRLHRRFSRQLPLLLAEQFAGLSPELVVQLLSACEPAYELAEHELDELQRYASGRNLYDQCAAALWFYCGATPGALAGLRPALAQVVVRKVLQRRDWTAVAQAQGVAGRAAVDDLLRLAFRELLALQYQQRALQEEA